MLKSWVRHFVIQCFSTFLLLTTAALAQHAYVSNSGAGTVSVIDTSNNTVVSTIPVGSGPSSLAVTPDGSKVYVANSLSNSISVIAASTMTVTNTVTVGKAPAWVAITPNGSAVYVANAGSNSVSIIDVASNAVVSTVAVGSNPVRVRINGNRAYVANAGSKSVSVLDTSSKSVVTTILVGLLPTGFDLATGTTTGTGGGSGQAQSLEALPETVDTINAAIDLLTASGNVATSVSCGGSLVLNCAGGTPSTSPAQIQFLRISVSESDDGVALPNTTYSFSATLSAATLTDIPINLPLGDCGMKIDTSQGSSPTITVTGNLNFASHASGDPIDEVDFSNVAITGLEAADVSLDGGFSCSIANIGTAVFFQTIEQTLLGRVGGGRLCGVVGPALFQSCPLN